MNKLSPRIEGLTLALALLASADLGHFHNRIPIAGSMPFLMSFESHLPRYFGGENTALFKFLRRRLAGPQCRRIVAMSQCAKRLFLQQHADAPEYGQLTSKLEVIYPNMIMPAYRCGPKASPLPLRLVFVGGGFGRKGGAVAVRAAEIARTRISSLEVDWSDPQQEEFFAPYLRLIDVQMSPLTGGWPMCRFLRFYETATFPFSPPSATASALALWNPSPWELP